MMLPALFVVVFVASGLTDVSAQGSSIVNDGSELQFDEELALAIAKCQNGYANYTFEEDEDQPPYEGPYCPAEYDLILCWPPAKAGETTYLNCPELADQYQTSMAFKECTVNGTWSNKISAEEMYLSGKYCKCLHCKIIYTINSFGCGLSALACIVAFLIFMFSRRLWCRRNHIHWHLISSFILNYFVYFIGLGVNDTNNILWLKRVLDTLYYYALMTNYFWMLVEGLYLHTLVVLALRVDANRISFLIYVFIGWILPAVFVSIWAIISHLTSNSGEFAKSLSENGSTQDYTCVIGPIGIALLINCIFLFNIMRVLCKKLRETMRNEEQQSWRGAKATMVLVVLLGVHYILFLIIFPVVESQLPITATLVLQYINTLLTSTQGVQVSVIYVFLNSEVKGSIRRTTVKIMQKQDCPCIRRRLASGRQRNSSYSRWFTDENTCLSTLRSSPSRHPGNHNGGGRVISSDAAATLNGDVYSCSGGDGGAVETHPGAMQNAHLSRHPPIEEKSEEYENYELGALPEKVQLDEKNAADAATAKDDENIRPPQEDVPLLTNKSVVNAVGTAVGEVDENRNGSPRIDIRDVERERCSADNVENQLKADETQHLTAHNIVC